MPASPPHSTKPRHRKHRALPALAHTAIPFQWQCHLRHFRRQPTPSPCSSVLAPLRCQRRALRSLVPCRPSPCCPLALCWLDTMPQAATLAPSPTPSQPRSCNPAWLLKRLVPEEPCHLLYFNQTLGGSLCYLDMG